MIHVLKPQIFLNTFIVDKINHNKGLNINKDHLKIIIILIQILKKLI